MRMASSRRRRPRDTRRPSVFMRLILWLQRQLMAQLAPPPDADVKLLEGLSDVTKIAYRRAFAEFQNWARRRRMPLDPPTDYDKALWCYCDNVTKSKYELTLSAVERCYPPLKRNIPWSRARCTAQAVAHPVRHHDPMVWEIALALAWGLQVVGGRVIAQVFLLMRLCGLRPGEAIRLCPEDCTNTFEPEMVQGFFWDFV